MSASLLAFEAKYCHSPFLFRADPMRPEFRTGADPGRRRTLGVLAGLCACAGAPAFAQAPAAARKPPAKGWVPLSAFMRSAGDNEAEALAALRQIAEGWHEAYFSMLLEVLVFSPYSNVHGAIMALLQTASGIRGESLDALYHWQWSRDRLEHPQYAAFKAALYERIDPRFREYFDNDPKRTIRLDEVRWGGVARDGIPPLKNPKMIAARDAGYLDGDNVVFGVAIDGDVRAYPKRILAWHEMVKDRIGGRELNGVYCTLCGSMVVYVVLAGGLHHELGTSGFLYRSNKLMYDHATKSMWSTLEGKPVIGRLVGRGIELERLHVVTTTWKEWRRRHPATLVLSLDTGHQRNYGEGVAYNDYFSNDRLMFGVPKLDARLANKTEVLALRDAGARADPLAISAAYLAAHPVYHDRVGATAFVVLTDPSGANRVYESGGVRFAAWNGDLLATDSEGRGWKVGEDALIGPGRRKLRRLPAHRAFWFGWYSAYPETRLVK